MNLWLVTRTEAGWGEPQYLEAVNSEGYDGYPALTAANTLYFTSDRAGGLGQSDIYMAKWNEGKYSEVQHVPALSSSDHENDLTIDPQGQFVVLNRYFADTNAVDLFISMATEAGWSNPQPLANINTNAWELTPALSPDGRYFFYQVNGQIQQIDLAILLEK